MMKYISLRTCEALQCLCSIAGLIISWSAIAAAEIHICIVLRLHRMGCRSSGIISHWCPTRCHIHDGIASTSIIFICKILGLAESSLTIETGSCWLHFVGVVGLNNLFAPFIYVIGFGSCVQIKIQAQPQGWILLYVHSYRWYLIVKHLGSSNISFMIVPLSSRYLMFLSPFIFISHLQNRQCLLPTLRIMIQSGLCQCFTVQFSLLWSANLFLLLNNLFPKFIHCSRLQIFRFNIHFIAES